jgi:hypothetical protein
MKCSLCGNPEIFCTEQRPRDHDGRLIEFGFCAACWQELQDQRADKDPWISQRYVIFLEYLAGRYERRIVHGHAKRLLPKKRVDKVTTIVPNIPHENVTCEIGRQASQAIQRRLFLGPQGYERPDSGLDLGLREASREETEKITSIGARPTSETTDMGR